MSEMEELIRQIRQASAAGLYYLALYGALVLPDICGALASDDGSASGSKYKAWLRDNLPERAGDVDLIYGLRCSLLHQGRARPHGSSIPLAFTYPSPDSPQLHAFVTQVRGEEVGWYSIPLFVEEVTQAAERWFSQFGDTATVTRNLERFARLHPEGLPPHAEGFPVIA